MRTRLVVALASLCLSCGSAGTPAKSAEPALPVEPAAPPPPAINFHLPALFGDHMILQSDRENPIWGWDHPGQLVTITFDNQPIPTKAGPDGRWQATLLAAP